jgi:beta-galactosidase
MRTRISFDRGWRFRKEGKERIIEGASPRLNDSDWRLVDIPHDWGVESAFQGELPSETGKLPWDGVGWYRKTLPPQEAEKRVFLDFDGAMSQPKIYVDGKLAGEWAYGYASFRVEITKFLTPGKQSQIAVELNNLPDSSRWYPGGGLYRHVWLVTTNQIHIAHHGVFVYTPEVGTANATVCVETNIPHSNLDVSLAGVIVQQAILWRGEIVAQTQGTWDSKATLTVPKPKLWSVETPNLYTLRTTVLVNNTPVDEMEIIFGIRSVVWDAEKGVLINGKHVPLLGVCNHHDLGILGAAVHERAIERQLEILKEMGCNAIRTSHNPPAPELLDACDRRGFLVMDEVFDCW